MKWIRTLVPLAVAGVVGCGSGDNIKLVPVSGTVTLNGKPLAGANVMFIPDAANKSSTGGNDVTGPEGNFKLLSMNRSGVAPGKYKVSISPPLPPEAKIPEVFKDDPLMYRLSLQAAAGKEEKKALPAGTKFDFDREVPAEGATFDFDCKSASSTGALKSG